MKRFQMKRMHSLLSVLALGLLGAALANGGTFSTPLQHVIVIVQENRTPDNLFGADTALIRAGAHIVPAGHCHGTTIPLAAWQLDACFNPSHTHPAWLAIYDNGAMDGACDVSMSAETCNEASLPTCSPGARKEPCPNYTYVSNSTGLLNPYFQLAAQYGFANYMFQTNQGPSFPAHQFLFSGTSAPTAYPAQFFDWFAAENLGGAAANNGCIGSANSVIMEVDPATGDESAGYRPPYAPPANTAGFPCYEHNTLADVLESAGVSWRYYSGAEGSLWTAPDAIHHICLENNGRCSGPDWPPTGTKVSHNPGQVLTDLGVNGTGTNNCQLQEMSWVIPDGHWSDHPGTVGHDGGPSWVAAIVNAVGGYDNSGVKLPVQCNYWADTAILITWDDWGGFYDDVNPITTIGGGSSGYPGGGGNGSKYVYGFRVPLLVVSPYAKAGYISGPANNPTCPNFYCHDFGSILKFSEYVFGQQGKALGPIGSSQWPYADSFVQDLGNPPNNYSLYDFFDFHRQPRTFTPITGAKYATKCFLKPTACFPHFQPAVPDGD
jgi:phospholipase C